MDSRPPDFSRLITSVSRALQARGLPFMLIGGQAVLLHGDPRLTRDIDITLGITPEGLPQLLAVCEEAALHPLPADPLQFVRDTFVLPARSIDTDIRVDFIFSSTPYEAQAIARAALVPMGDTVVPFATAEDLVLHKLFAGRPRDIEDANSVIRRKGAQLDWDYLERWAAEFAQVEGRENMPTQVRELKSQID